jgi:transcriptional regulator with XRE-family HTH domain
MLRSRERLSQEEVAARAGLNRSYVSDLESGRRGPNFASVVLLARGLGVSLSELVQLFEQRLADVHGD